MAKALFDRVPVSKGGALPISTVRPTRFVMLNDVHVPWNIPLDGVFDFIEDFRPDYVVLGGDILNMDPFDHWEKRSLRKAKKMPAVLPYYEAANKSFFRPLLKAAPRAQRIYLEGNHERWAQNFLDTSPEMEGLVEPYLHAEGITLWVPNRRLVNIGNLHFIHGDDMAEGQHHAAKMVSLFRRNLRYGHRHDIQEASFKSPVDTKESYTAKSCGSLCMENPPYMRNYPNAQQSALTYGFVEPGGHFVDTTTRIIDGKFLANGRTYKE